MAKATSTRTPEETRRLVLHAAARLFLQKGYTATTLREISKEANVGTGSLMYFFASKENILCDLVAHVLEGQFQSTARFLQEITEDKLLFWAAETTLQLYITESDESIRELYIAAYSHPKTSTIIHHTIAGKMASYFKEYYPNYEMKDFYELEIASGGIIRGFMSVPCDMYFTIERKVRRYLEISFLVYKAPEEKIQEAIQFVSQFDFEAIARQTVEQMMKALDVSMVSAEA